MIIGTAGHIDHGKSALVRALTGSDPDRLKEEKARGITIDLGYAYRPIDNGAVLGFVDVPGHEKFIHNMLAGATGIDFVLLVVAADDGPMPQTREHLAILDLLGLSRGVVVLSKVDTVDEARRARATREIITMLATTGLASMAVHPVSVVTGEGVESLAALLQEAAADSMPSRQSATHFRMAVDRSFTIKGIGTVVTGAVQSGSVSVDDRLIVSPSGIEVRVRSLHAQNQASNMGSAGQRCALNLVAPQLEKSDISRGQSIIDAVVHAPTNRLDVRLRLLPSEARALRHWTPVHVHIGTSDIIGRVALLEGQTLASGATMLAQLVLEQPVAALCGDRFIIRDQSAQRTLGGGQIIDPDAVERGRRMAPRLRMLAALEQGSPEVALTTLLADAVGGVDLDWFFRIRNIAAPAQADLLRDVAHYAVPVPKRRYAFAFTHWQTIKAAVVSCLAEFHARRPDSAGMTIDEVRSALLNVARLDKAIILVVLSELLVETAIQRVNSRYQLPGHEQKLTQPEQILWERAAPVLANAGLESVRVSPLAQQLNTPDEPLRAMLTKLVRCGRLYHVRRDHYFLPEVIADLARHTELITQATPKQVLTVGPFREATGISRNLAIPMLEFFDRSGLTIRFGHGRRLRRDSAAVFGDTTVSTN
jgi:selenocysteine-specific elongation factor